MILNELIKTPELFAIIRLDVSENGIGVTFDDELLNANGDLRDDKICVLKLDDYAAYNSRSTHNPPKVIDNLIIVKCCDDLATIYLVELRQSNGKRPTKRLHPDEIEEKFKTATGDFIEGRYPEIFKSERIKDIKAYLVSDPWNHSGRDNAQELFNKKLKSSALDAYSSRKPLKILGRNILINPIVPPDPVIRPC